MLWLQHKYASLLSSHLTLFHKTTDATWNFRCPLCGDSQKNKNKCRGYILPGNGSLRFYCHNCGAAMRFPKFLEIVAPALYDQYVIERIAENKQQKEKLVPSKTIYCSDKYLSNLPKISQLPANHICKQYVISRQIPTTFHHKLFFCENFKHSINQVIPNKFDLSKGDHDRLIIPVFYQDQLIAIQGRSLDDHKAKYISIVFDEFRPKIYNQEVCNFNKPVIVTEGPINSMFIENAVSGLGRSTMLQEVDKLNVNKSNLVLCFDNEPRNSDIVKNMLHAIAKGYKIVIWPSYYQSGDDINDIILKRISGDYCKTESVEFAGQLLKTDLLQNAYGGLEGDLRVKQWAKV